MIKPGRLEGFLPASHIFFTARVDIDWLVQRLPSALICSSHHYLNWYLLSYSTPPWRLKPGTGSGPAFRARRKDSLWGPLPQGQLPGQALKWRKVLKSCLSPHWGLPFLLSLCAEPSLAVKGSCTECTPWAHSKLRLLGVPAAQLVKNPPAMWRTWVRSLGWEDPLEKGKATRSIILVWRIPWTV